MDDQVFIQRRFTITDPETGNEFSDAIVMLESEYNALTNEQIEAMKQERFTNWKTLSATPPVEEGAVEEGA